MDECSLSFLNGRIAITFRRQGRSIERRVLAADEAERLAARLVGGGGATGAVTALGGGALLDGSHARAIGRQLRDMAEVARAAGSLFDAAAAPAARGWLADLDAGAVARPHRDTDRHQHHAGDERADAHHLRGAVAVRRAVDDI